MVTFHTFAYSSTVFNSYFGITLSTQCVLIEYIYVVCVGKRPTAPIKWKCWTPFRTAHCNVPHVAPNAIGLTYLCSNGMWHVLHYSNGWTYTALKLSERTQLHKWRPLLPVPGSTDAIFQNSWCPPSCYINHSACVTFEVFSAVLLRLQTSFLKCRPCA